MRRITEVTVIGDSKLQLTFDEGTTGEVDVSCYGFEGVFSAWRNPEVFRSVSITSSGALVWGDDIELCPDALYLKVTGKKPEDLFPALKRVDAIA